MSLRAAPTIAEDENGDVVVYFVLDGGRDRVTVTLSRDDADSLCGQLRDWLAGR